MAEKFQDIRHRQTIYDRPNERWVCGASCQGKSCYLGPDAGGGCRAGAVFEGRKAGECLPRQQGDQWVCARPETHGGSACAEGPQADGSCCRLVAACRPQPTLRHLRGKITRWAALITAGLMVVLLAHRTPGGGTHPVALSPGALTSAHSALESDCAACHSDLRLGPSRLRTLTNVEMDHRALQDGKKCLECHQEIGGKGGRHAFNAHGMDPVKLTAKNHAASQPDALLRLASFISGGRTRQGNDQLACGTCHSEHHGLGADLKTFTNRQCQVCHQQQFASFAHGHPQFEALSYPANRRTRIQFDHASHYAKHFAETAKETPAAVPTGFNAAKPHAESLSCAACHAASENGGTMSVVSFETSCAACHTDDTHSGNKLPVIGYPQIDMDTLNTRLAAQPQPRSTGLWPPEAPDKFPWLILYLLPEEARAAWLRLARADVSLPDLKNMKDEQLSDVERVVWAVKELFTDLCANTPTESPSGLVGHQELLRRLRAANCDEAAFLINGLPPDAFDEMRRVFGPEACAKVMQEVAEYRQKRLPPPVQAKTASAVPPAAQTAAAAGGEDFGAPAKPALPAKPAEESFGAPPPAAVPAAALAAAPAPSIEPLERTNWTALGGWHQQFGTIYYKSSGHADPLLKAWLEHVLKDVNDPLRLATLREGLDFQKGILSQATGHCLKCHSVEERRDAQGQLTGAVINWLSYGKKVSKAQTDRPLTRFNHMAHLLFANCRQCHVTTEHTPPGKGYADAFPGEQGWSEAEQWFVKANPAVFHSNFEQISKTSCAACHVPEKSGDNCLQCHQYHHPLPDGPADMLEWLRAREAQPASAKASKTAAR